jgi:hypothetical protein
VIPEEDAEKFHRYLLGTLSAPEDEAMEAAYLARDEVFLRLLAAEEDLIDAYVSGGLSEADRRRFDEHFLASPARRERVAFARALARLAPGNVSAAAPAVAPRLAASPRRRDPAWSGLAAALALALMGSAWLLVRARGVGTELARAQVEREAAVEQSRLAERRTAELQTRLERLSEELALARAAGALVAGVLTPGLEREGTRPSLQIPPETEWVRLRLVLEEDTHPRYAATLQTPDGETLATLRGLRSAPATKGRAVDLTLPADALEDGTYVVELQGIASRGTAEAVASYHLRVVRATTTRR